MSAERPLAERFWQFVRKGSPDECWPWVGATDQHGYGMLHRKGGSRRAPRIMLELIGKLQNPKVHVLHKCDTPICVNPDHLFIGTNADNVADKIAKGRQRRGSKSPSALLNEQQAANMKALFLAGVNRKDLSTWFGCPYHTTRALLQLKAWQDQGPQFQRIAGIAPTLLRP